LVIIDRAKASHHRELGMISNKEVTISIQNYRSASDNKIKINRLIAKLIKNS